jgi:hypothetical protein
MTSEPMTTGKIAAEVRGDQWECDVERKPETKGK